MEADIGVVTDNYSYKVENISTSEDTKQYIARVRVPNHNSEVQGPNVRLRIREKPGEFLVTVQKHPCARKSMSGVYTFLCHGARILYLSHWLCLIGANTHTHAHSVHFWMFGRQRLLTCPETFACTY